MADLSLRKYDVIHASRKPLAIPPLSGEMLSDSRQGREKNIETKFSGTSQCHLRRSSNSQLR
jgi:hypothetical protein